MNLLRQLAKKLGLPVAVVALWLLDDLVVFLPDAAVWAITNGVLNLFGLSDRQKALKAFWTGKGAVP